MFWALVLTDLPPPRTVHSKGRPRVRGDVLPKPEALAKDDTKPWLTCTAQLYGKAKLVHYKTFCAQWYQACGVLLLRIVVVRVDTGRIGLRVFFCTDPSVSVVALLETYAGRWNIEVCFRNLKQLFGFADSSARKQESVERTAPFVGAMYSLLIFWFCQHVHSTADVKLQVRPWYPHKRTLSFADILRTAQHVLAPIQVLDLIKQRKDLRESSRPCRLAAPRPSKMTAPVRNRLAA